MFFQLEKIVKTVVKSIQDFVVKLADIMRNKAPEDLKLAWIFRTQRDARVCPKCQKFEGALFAADDTRYLPPLHENCRCYQEFIERDPFEIAKTTKGARIDVKHEKAIEKEYGTATTPSFRFIRSAILEKQQEFYKILRENLKKSLGRGTKIEITIKE